MPYRATPLAVGGIPADYPSQIGRGLAQIFPTYDPKPTIQMQQRESARRRTEKREEEEAFLEREELPTGLHPTMRRFLEVELNDSYKKRVEEIQKDPKKLNDIIFKSDLEREYAVILGTAEDSKKLSSNKRMLQIQTKGINQYEVDGSTEKAQEYWDEIHSDDFLKQYRGDPTAAIVALEAKLKKIQLTPEPFDVTSFQKEIRDSTSVMFTDEKPYIDEFGNEIYPTGVDKKAHRNMSDINSDIRWKFDPKLQKDFPPEKEGQQFSQELRDIAWAGRDVPKRTKKIREAEKVKAREKTFYHTDSYDYPKRTITLTKAKGEPLDIPKGLTAKQSQKMFLEGGVDIVEYEIIRSKRDTKTPFTEFSHPTKKGETVLLRPFSFRELPDGMYLFGEEAESGDDIYIPYEKIEARFREKFEGATIDLIKGQGGKGKTEKSDLRKKYNY